MMEAWLEPITRITADQDDELDKVHQSIKELSEYQSKIVEHLESEAAASDDDSA